MRRDRGYIGLLVLLISTAILVALYVYYSPLKQVPKKGGGTTTEAQADIQAAQDVRNLMQQQSAKTGQLLQQ
jgi:hypothetical protein